MVLQVSSTEAHQGRRQARADGLDYWRTEFLTPARQTVGARVIEPMAFLVEQSADTAFSAHFHQADQFQVVAGGAGRLGRHEVRPGSVHYANAFSPYGPVEAGAEGLDYFTLRNGWDPGARFLPAATQELTAHRPKSNRQAYSEDFDLPSAEALLALRESRSQAIIAPQPDGLGAWLHLVAPGGSIAGHDPCEGYGQFWIVLEGAMGDAALPPRSCLFVAPDEPALAAHAGSDGLAVLELQFPNRGWAAPQA